MWARRAGTRHSTGRNTPGKRTERNKETEKALNRIGRQTHVDNWFQR